MRETGTELLALRGTKKTGYLIGTGPRANTFASNIPFWDERPEASDYQASAAMYPCISMWIALLETFEVTNSLAISAASPTHNISY